MMNDKNRINCEIAEDLIPLYIDNALSKSSVEVLEEHLAGCDNCSSKVRLLQTDAPVAGKKDISQLKSIRTAISKKRLIACAVTAAVMLLLFGGYLLINFLSLITTDYSYSELEGHLRVVSASELSTTGDVNRVSVIYDSDDKHILCETLYNKVGESNGKIQAEVYLVVCHKPLEDINPFYRSYRYMDSVQGYLLFCDDQNMTFENYGKTIVNPFRDGTWHFDIEGIDTQKDVEIVRIYYSSWQYGSNDKGDINLKINDNRRLLWSK